MIFIQSHNKKYFYVIKFIENKSCKKATIKKIKFGRFQKKYNQKALREKR